MSNWKPHDGRDKVIYASAVCPHVACHGRIFCYYLTHNYNLVALSEIVFKGLNERTIACRQARQQ